MTPADLIDLLFAVPDSVASPDLRTFLKSHGPGVAASGSAFERLVAVAVQARTRLEAGAAGHQASIRRLFPATPDDAIMAFCVSEEHGPNPSKIVSTLEARGEGFVLNGSKRWGSMSPLADVLYVAASIGHRDGRNQLRMVALPSDRAGLSLDSSAYGGYAGHMPIADLKLDQIQVAADEILPDDAYDAFIKPFRLIEDVYNTTATQIGLFRLGRAHGWPQPLLEDLLGLILQAQALSQTPMSRPQDVVAMSGWFRASSALWEGLGENWALVPSDKRAAWTPETGTLGVAARARETRRQNAWVALAS
jgi:alkylation response protein AidB-like acyl-CoA dehydrogenase